jgi:hypothetical protein
MRLLKKKLKQGGGGGGGLKFFFLPLKSIFKRLSNFIWQILCFANF